MLVQLKAVMKTLVSVFMKTLIVMMMMHAQLIAVVLTLDAHMKLYSVQINLAILLTVILLMDANGQL
jgi:hypothetical protein